MTVVAAFRKGNHTYVAADTGTSDDTGMIWHDPTKIWKPNNKLVLGFAGSGGQICEAMYSKSWKSLKVPAEVTPAWCFKHIYEPVAKTLEKHTERSKFSFDILVCTQESIHVVFEDGTVLPANDFVAIGCGALYAKGYYDACSKRAAPEKILRDMIKSCGACMDGVSPHAIVEKL